MRRAAVCLPQARRVAASRHIATGGLACPRAAESRVPHLLNTTGKP
jgi:hypothetical protein